MSSTFEEKIKQTKLTKSGRKIAEFFLQNPTVVPFQSMAEIAAQIGVSDVSIVRFARTLGYDGFVELKRALQLELCSKIDFDPSQVNPVAKFVTRKDSGQDRYNFIIEEANHIYTDIISQVTERNSVDLMQQAADKLFHSQRVFVAGIRSRRAAAVSFSTLLSMLTSGVAELTDEGYHSYLKMMDFTSADCVFFFTFGRFTQFEKFLLERVKESGAFLITATDQKASRAALASNLLLYCPGDVNLPFYSSVGSVMLAECLFNIITEQNWDNCRERIQLSEKYLIRTELKE